MNYILNESEFNFINYKVKIIHFIKEVTLLFYLSLIIYYGRLQLFLVQYSF